MQDGERWGKQQAVWSDREKQEQDEPSEHCQDRAESLEHTSDHPFCTSTDRWNSKNGFHLKD